ncbi:MAG: hypothetical protein CFE36_06255 [Sphingomonadaceae bacterium PASS1]|jgi:hypothetical protein|nr:MAG: hypothetical protein CFE36_06255 [Sphingomonadaceae bacterium PASS1]
MQNISRTNVRRTVGHELLFCAWLANAAGGDRYEYHRGFLAKDIDIGPKRRFGDKERKILERLSERVRWACDKGCVHLVQERLGPDCYSYIAIARPRAPGAGNPLADIELSQVA